MLTALAASFALCCPSAQPAADHSLSQGGTLQEGSPENLLVQLGFRQFVIKYGTQPRTAEEAGSVWSSGKAKRRLYCSQGPRENIKHSMPNRPSFQISLTALFALFRQNKELKCYKASAALGPRRPPSHQARPSLLCSCWRRAQAEQAANTSLLLLATFCSHRNHNSLLWLVHK